MSGRGVTLVETLVACFLMTVVMGAVYAALLLVQRSWDVASGRTDASVNCEVAVERLRHEVQETTAASITVSPDRAAVCFATARDSSGSFQTDCYGCPQWQAFLVYYVSPSEGVLRRRRAAGKPPTPLDTKTLDSLCDGSGDVVAYNVTGLTTTVSGSSADFTLACTASGLGRTDQMALTAQIVMRN